MISCFCPSSFHQKGFSGFGLVLFTFDLYAFLFTPIIPHMRFAFSTKVQGKADPRSPQGSTIL